MTNFGWCCLVVITFILLIAFTVWALHSAWPLLGIPFLPGCSDDCDCKDDE